MRSHHSWYTGISTLSKGLLPFFHLKSSQVIVRTALGTLSDGLQPKTYQIFEHATAMVGFD